MAITHLTRSRWAAFGAAVAVTLGGGITLVAQAADSGTPSSYTPITPCRLMDTRPAPFTVGPRNTPIGQGENHSVLVHGTNGACTIPANATGIATNTTVTNGTAASFLTLFPGDANRPNASNLNWVANQSPTPNQVTVGLSPDGRIRVYNDQGTVNVIIDIVGIYTPAAAGTPGAAGPAGPAGAPAWGNIPSGTTVTGPARFDIESHAAGGDIRWTFHFPAKAPVQPTAANFSADASAATTDDDASCTGTVLNPTAPPGKVCIYLDTTSGLSNLTGEVFSSLLNKGFEIWGDPTGIGDTFLQATWAYTAP